MIVFDVMPLIPLKEVARLAGTSESNIRRLRLRGRMPAAKGRLGQTWVFDQREIERWLPKRHRQFDGRPR